MRSVFFNAAIGVALFGAVSGAMPHSAQAAVLQQDADLGGFNFQRSAGTSKSYAFGQQERVTTVERTNEATYNDNEVTFDLFDPTLGTLTGVGITTIYRNLNGTVTVSDSCITQRVPFETRLCSDSSSIAGRLDYGLNFSNLSPFNPVIAPGVNTLNDTVDRVSYGFSLGDGNDFDLLETLAFTTFNSSVRDSASDLAAFTGVGTYTVNFASYWYNILATTCTGNDIFAFGVKVGQRDIETCSGSIGLDFTGSAEVQVRYTYNEPVAPPPAVPLPAGLPLLLAGMGALGLLRARHRV